MKHITPFIKDDYNEIDLKEYNEFLSTHVLTIFTDREVSIICNVTGFSKTNVIFYNKVNGYTQISNNRSGTMFQFNGLSKYIIKFSDEWYIVGNKPETAKLEDNYTLYKCDQLSGAIGCLSFIFNKNNI